MDTQTCRCILESKKTIFHPFKFQVEFQLEGSRRRSVPLPSWTSLSHWTRTKVREGKPQKVFGAFSFGNQAKHFSIFRKICLNKIMWGCWKLKRESNVLSTQFVYRLGRNIEVMNSFKLFFNVIEEKTLSTGNVTLTRSLNSGRYIRHKESCCYNLAYVIRVGPTNVDTSERVWERFTHPLWSLFTPI